MRSFQFIEPQLQLLDFALQLFRFAPELHAPQSGQQQLQVLDFVVARLQLFPLRGEQLVFREELFVLRQNQRAEGSSIELIQIRENARRDGHCREVSRVALLRNKNEREK